MSRLFRTANKDTAGGRAEAPHGTPRGSCWGRPWLHLPDTFHLHSSSAIHRDATNDINLPPTTHTAASSSQPPGLFEPDQQGSFWGAVGRPLFLLGGEGKAGEQWSCRDRSQDTVPAGNEVSRGERSSCFLSSWMQLCLKPTSRIFQPWTTNNKHSIP